VLQSSEVIHAFLGVAAAAFFAGALAFLVEAAFFAGAAEAVVLVTRPDLVLPRTTGLSSTAGAWLNVSHVLMRHAGRQQHTAGAVFLGLLVLAVAAFLGAALVAVAFLVEVEAFLGAAALVVWQQQLAMRSPRDVTTSNIQSSSQQKQPWASRQSWVQPSSRQERLCPCRA